MRVGKGNEDNLDEAIVGEAGMRSSIAPSNSLISDKDMISRFLTLCVSQVTRKKSACTLGDDWSQSHTEIVGPLNLSSMRASSRCPLLLHAALRVPLLDAMQASRSFQDLANEATPSARS